jgi:membrane protein required for colicin V production
MEYAVIDIVLGVIILILALRACLNGIVTEAFGMAAIVLGLLFAFLFYEKCGILLVEKFPILSKVKFAPSVAGFAVLFLLVFIVVKILTAILRDIINRIKLSGIDHALGFIFGAAEGLVLTMLVIFIISVQPLFNPGKVLDKSILNKTFGNTVTELQETLIKKE